MAKRTNRYVVHALRQGYGDSRALGDVLWQGDSHSEAKRQAKALAHTGDGVVVADYVAYEIDWGHTVSDFAGRNEHLA